MGTWRPNTDAHCAEHILCWAGQREGEEEAVDAEGPLCVLFSPFSSCFFSFSFCLQAFLVDFNNSHEHFISRDQQDGPDAVCVDGGTDDRE